MEDISNRTLALLLVTGIVVMLGSAVYTLNGMNRIMPTGRVQTGYGNVTLTVENQVSIIMNNDVIDFGTGFINTSCTNILTDGNDYANLTAGSVFTDSTDCWTGTPGAGTSLLVENNGNLDASITLSGPSNASFFSGYVGSYPYGIQVKSRDSEAGACEGTALTAWTDMDDNATICTDLKWDPEGQDELAIDVNVIIPKDIASGTYEDATIELYAVQA